MSGNLIWINEMIKEISDEIITKYEKLNYPFRTVMVKMNYCYCCKSHRKDINYLAEDSFRGRFNLVGWLYCNDCALLVNLAHKYCFLDRNYLRYSEAKFLTKHYFYFWRISYTKNIKPYLEKCFLDGSFNNIIYMKNNRIKANIVWNEDNDTYTKLINLSNLIYYNNWFFGNKNTKFKYLQKNWVKLINYEYEIVRNYKIIEKICKGNSLSNDIENIIKLFLDNIY